jgi:hypothetical protein
MDYNGIIFIIIVIICIVIFYWSLIKDRRMLTRQINAQQITQVNLINISEMETLSISYGDDCVICLGPMSSNDELLKVRCGHMFHKVCLIPWLVQKQECPLCRLQL